MDTEKRGPLNGPVTTPCDPTAAQGAPTPALGDSVKPYGEVVAVGTINGEKYVWFVHDDGAVAMIPRVVLDANLMAKSG